MASPLKGKVIPLNQVKDGAFASEILGKGCAIVPSEGILCSPVDGKVATLFPTLHAVGIVSNDGAEILMHIGLDTVQLEGKGFKAFVAQGDTVKKGQKLIEFDIDQIKAAGYSVETPVVVTNSAQYLDILVQNVDEVERQDHLLSIV